MTKLTQKQKLELLEIFNDISLTKYEAIESIWQKAQDEILDEWIEWLNEKYLYLRALGQDEPYQRLFAEKSYELRNRKEKPKDD